MNWVWRLIRGAPAAALSPCFAVVALLSLWFADLLWKVFGSTRELRDTAPQTGGASIVIPNWNGKDLLEKYLPSVLRATEGNAAHEVIVVDNGSTDGSAEYVRQQFPTVRVIALEENLGFGGGSNRGFREARNDVVVLLNSDMRVDPGFLAPLLAGFTDEKVFAVSCQIFFSDPNKVREETGLTEGWWQQGGLRVGHRIDEQVTGLYPCFYGGGGSCAFDRRKFQELGGFDELLRPFYFEDTDLGYLAWKRGWKILYQPQSKVWHEHRGTIGKTFSPHYIQGVLRKNYLLLHWKNVHEPGRLLANFAYSWAGGLVRWLFGTEVHFAGFGGLARAFAQLPRALRSRWRARSLAVVSDAEALRRPMGGYFRDRFETRPADPERLSVLFVAPYPVSPPTHGGAVFMSQTIRELGKRTNLHVLALLDSPDEEAAHEELREVCASMEFMVRLEGQPKGAGAIEPFAVREFRNRDLLWRIHRRMYTDAVDVLQLEYTQMGQYGGEFRQAVVSLFEHDVYFQSIARGPMSARSLTGRTKAWFEYLRALRYEVKTLPRMDLVQVCTAENRDVLVSFIPEIRDRIDDGLRAGVDPSRYEFEPGGREANTLLFLGSFRHLPNLEALNWFLEEVFPHVLQLRPETRLIVAGSNPPPAYSLPDFGSSLEVAGFVPDVRDALRRYAVFVCPILSGSGVRVKLLEAFSAGIPVVSTYLGAEGLSSMNGEVCALAGDGEGFAREVAGLLADPASAEKMAVRARAFVEAKRDIRKMTEELERRYRRSVQAKRRATSYPAG